MRFGSHICHLVMCMLLMAFAGPALADGELTREIQFEVPSQPLSSALLQFSEQSSVQVVTLGSSLSGLTSPGVSGKYRVGEALRLILGGTGLTFNSVGGNTVSLVPAGKQDTAASSPARAVELETIIVMSEKLPDVYSGGQVARGSRLGLIGNRDVMDTPFSTVNYTNEYIKNIGAARLTDVLTSDPSITLTSTVARGDDTILIRGFRLLTENMTFDGLYGSAPPRQIAVENVERIEVIKGPAALLGGMSPNGDIGGSVNITPKRATEKPITQFTALYSASSEFGGHLDVGRRFGSESQFGVRFSGVYRDGEGALENNSRETLDGMLGLDFRQGNLRLTADVGYQERDYRGIDSDHYLAGDVTEVPRAPGANDAHFQPWGLETIDDSYGSARAEYEFTPNAMIYAAAGFARSELRLVGSYAFPMSASGDFTENFWKLAQDLDMNTGEVGLRLVANTGAVEHQLAFAAMKLERKYGQLALFDFYPAVQSNVYSPTFVAPPPGDYESFPAIPKFSNTTLTSFAFADTMSFAEGRALVTLGLRMQRVEFARFDSTGARISTFDYDEKAVTPAVGVVFKPREHISLYANYSQGLSQGPTAPPRASNHDEVFPPSKTEQFEAGVKVDHGAFMTSVALFQVAQPSGLLDPITQVFSVDGENRHRGIELNTAGELVKGVRLLGGITLMEPELTKTENGTFDGRTDPGVSKVNVSLGAEWDTPWIAGLTVSARGIHASDFYIDSANLLESPGYTTLALGARYGFLAQEKPVTVRFNLQNAFGEKYWNGPNLYRGGPRAASLSATVDF